jgi:Transposase DDE domain
MCVSRLEKAKWTTWTTLIMIDSQAVQNTCNPSVDSKGFCFYKSTNGIKRHLAVDPLRFPFFTHGTSTNVSDNTGLIEMLTLHIDYFRSKPMSTSKITILLDHGYHPNRLRQELEKVYLQIMRKIKFVACFPKGTFDKALNSREGSPREVWICSGYRSVGVRLRRGEAL